MTVRRQHGMWPRHNQVWKSILTTFFFWKCAITFRPIIGLKTLWNLTWPWKTIGHIFYATWNWAHNFVAISQFKLELQSGNTQLRSKSAISGPMSPWNLTDDLEKTIEQLFHATSSFVRHFTTTGEFKLGLQSGNAQFGSKSAIFCPVITKK